MEINNLKVWDTGLLKQGWETVGTLSTETDTAYVRRSVEKQYYRAVWNGKIDERFYCRYEDCNTILIGIDKNQLLQTDTHNGQTYQYTAIPFKYIEEFLINELNVKPSGGIYIRKYEMAIDIGIKRHKLLETLDSQRYWRKR